MIPNEDLQKFITEWNFQHSPASFNAMIRDLEKGKINSEPVIKMTPLQKFEASERLKNVESQ